MLLGIEGETYGFIGDKLLKYFDFKTGEETNIDIENATASNSVVGGHGGGDGGIINSLYDYIANDCLKENLSKIEISVKNHLIAFAAEKSRVEDKIINFERIPEKIKS